MIQHAAADSSELTFLRNRVAELEAKATNLCRDYEHLKLLYERAPLAYQSLDEEGNFIEVNQAWLDSTGYNREEIIGRNFAEFLHPDWRAHFRENFPRFKAIGEILGVEFEMTRKDGSFFLVSFHGRIGKNSHGRFQQTHCIFQDITDQRRAETELKDNEHLLKVSQRLTKSGGWQWNVGKQTMTWTEQTYRIHDIDPEQLVQGSPEHIALSKACYNPADQPKIMTAFQRCVELGEPYDLEFSFTTHRGRKLWIRTTAEAVREEGQVTRVIGNILDITERKLVELKLRENEQALKAILNAAPETISLIDTNGIILMANKTMASRLQRSVEELIGQSAYDFFPPTIALQRKKSARQVVATGQPVVLVDEPNGRAIESHLWPVFDDAGCVSLIAVFALDITERKRMIEHLKIYQNIVSSAPDRIAFVNAQYRYVIVNDAYERFSGVSKEKIIGRTVAEYLGEEVFEKTIKPQFDKCLQGECVNFQEWFDYPTLGRRFVEVTYFPYRNIINQVTGIVSNIRDITNRKQNTDLLAARLRLSEASTTLGLNDLLTLALDEAEALTDSRIGFFHFFDDDQNTITLQGWSTATRGTFCQTEGFGRHYNLQAAGVWADCIRERRAIIHNDYSGLPHRRGMPEGHAPVVRELVVPVFRNERIVAIFAVGNKALDYSNKDIDLLANLGDLVWDIVLRKQAEEFLKESEERFRTLASLAPVGIYITSPEGQCRYANPRWCEMAGLTQAEALGEGWIAGLHPDDRAMVYSNWQQMVESEGHWGFEYRFRTPAGKTTWVFGLAAPQKDDTGKIVRYVGVNADITERKQLMDHLHKQADFTRRVLDSTDDHIAILDELGNIIDVNNAWTRFGVKNCRAGQTVGIGTSYFCNWSKDYGDTSFAAEAFAGILRVQKGELDSFQIIYPCHSPTENRWFNMKVLPLSGTLGHVMVAHSNITLLKQTEEMLTVALQEKDVLLREVHHRVKNNMAAIIGLFNLQLQNIVEPQVQTILGELSSRVKAMSLVHEKLYRSASVTRIDFQDYLQSLILHLQTSFSAPGIRFEVKAFGVGMPLDLAVPCGMIVNELITNAIKYAFPGERSATAGKDDCISITMAGDNDTLSLSVADNGVGLPPGFDFDASKTIGLSLVRMLGRHQLGGHYTLDRNGGTRFTLAFSLSKLEKTL